MDLIKKKGSLALHTEVTDIIAKVTLLIKEIQEFEGLKLNHDLTVYVLNLVTNMVKSKTIDVPSVAIQILTKVFNLDDTEVALLTSQVNYLLSSKAVSRISQAQLLWNAAKKKLPTL